MASPCVTVNVLLDFDTPDTESSKSAAKLLDCNLLVKPAGVTALVASVPAVISLLSANSTIPFTVSEASCTFTKL